MFKTKYRIIMNPFSGVSHYWIQKTTYLFGWKVWISSIGEYSSFDEGHGELREIPFFTIDAATERIRQLKLK